MPMRSNHTQQSTVARREGNTELIPTQMPGWRPYVTIQINSTVDQLADILEASETHDACFPTQDARLKLMRNCILTMNTTNPIPCPANSSRDSDKRVHSQGCPCMLASARMRTHASCTPSSPMHGLPDASNKDPPHNMECMCTHFTLGRRRSRLPRLDRTGLTSAHRTTPDSVLCSRMLA